MASSPDQINDLQLFAKDSDNTIPLWQMLYDISGTLPGLAWQMLYSNWPMEQMEFKGRNISSAFPAETHMGWNDLRFGPNNTLASCPWGPATAYGVGILTELYVIHMERSTSHRAIMSIGPLAAKAEVISCGRTDRQNHRPLLWITSVSCPKMVISPINVICATWILPPAFGEEVMFLLLHVCLWVCR